MVTALRPGPFVDSLCKKLAANMNEMRIRATKFMRLEELRDSGGQLKLEPQASHGHPSVDKFRVREKLSFLLPARPKETRLPRFTNYTPLNVSRGRVLEEALSAYLMPVPRKAATPRNADTSKHCHFHQNYGHTTEECLALKDKIE